MKSNTIDPRFIGFFILTLIFPNYTANNYFENGCPALKCGFIASLQYFSWLATSYMSLGFLIFHIVFPKKLLFISLINIFFKLLLCSSNLGQNIWILFYFLAQLFFTTSETELDYYHQKVSARAASQVAK